MLAFFSADFNLLYSCSLLFVICIALLEGVGLLVGLSIASALDDIIPIDLDIDTELPSGGLNALIGWLYLHRLPFLVWLLLFLTSFGIAGLSINYLIALPSLISFPIVLIIALFSCRILGKKIAIIMPKNETSAISSHSFAGKIATITIGKARKGSAAEAVLQDEFNQKHYLLVEPEEANQEFTQGTQVVLIEKLSRSWIAIEFKPL
ncbi:hypothetical protein CW745_13430 [Psychromonas sp. psych-6C06]|uniref:OB-fold-containig protein n=1 Tax=Psychromonas sp. psych-6C06 TaxID=2058089 RepID=UPI000C33F50C|nr:OB-fold-containig protein [Psychromonas sp. psych-6C06]PKF60870.1 hypothetical protein CW745_13430 [Psychromonas sp. psych-6C06]